MSRKQLKIYALIGNCTSVRDHDTLIAVELFHINRLLL